MYDQAAIGVITNDEIWQHRNKQLNLSKSDLNHLKAEYWQGIWDEQLFAYIKTLSASYTLGIISDATSGTRERVQQFIDLTLFKSVLFSYEVGVRKPHPKIYQQALDELNVPANDALFIDDRQQNVEGAIAVGMQGYLYTEFDRFQKFMNT